MKKIIIEGGYPLSGTISIGGAKNSAVALIPASLLADSKCVIKNVPNISDRDALFDIVKLLNCDIDQTGNVVSIDPSHLENTLINEELSVRLRASYYFMGVLLARYKKVEIFFPGGCNIGSRPIDLHLKGFKKLGAKVSKSKHKYTITADDLHGADIKLDFASVGATINIMFAATMAKGITTIKNAAREVEIINIADFLNKMGAKISGAGTGEITIEGVETLHGADIEVIPDRIEAGTYIMMGALLGNNLKIDGIVPEHNTALFDELSKMGVDYKLGDNYVIVNKVDHLKPVDITTLVYPGFPTDLGQPMSVLLTQTEGVSSMNETIWENRIGHYPYLSKMGADITLINQKAIINGKTELHGTDINATDLRGGASLIIAGLIADGTTYISDIDYILRGYENIVHKLSNVGAKIKIDEI